MASLIQRIAVQALRTFSNHGSLQDNLKQLKILASQVTAQDLNFDTMLVSNQQVRLIR